MAKMHSYGVNNQPFRLTILSWIALATFVTVLLVDSLKKGSFDFLSLKIYLSSASIFTITFAIIYWFYDQFIWKINRFDKVPDLSGTWMGMGSNPYFEPLRLELMQIEQHWSKICITVEIYEGNNFNPVQESSWSKSVVMGTEHSTIALITECERKYGDLTFNYYHSGEAIGQDPFEGVMFLKYKKRGEFHELKGNYLNTKRGQRFNKESQSEENFEGVIGRVVFRRVSSKLIELKEALRETENNDFLVEIYGELTSQVKGNLTNL
jgi:SMODS-associating 2TM, beta-strand rich effector domain